MNGYLLFETSSDWFIGLAGASVHEMERVADRSVSPAELASAVAQYCSARDPRCQLVIALHATSVVSATLPATANANKTDRRALLYELESSLPFDAEDATADFTGDATQLIGVAVRTSMLLPFIENVESRGMQVISIFPAATGAAQEYAGSGGDQCLAWRTDGSVELVACAGSQIRHWSHLADSSVATARTVQIEDLGGVRLVLDPQVETSDFAAEIGAVSESVASMPAQVSSFAASVLAGNVTPWIELRRDALSNGDPNRPYRKSLNRLLIAAAGLLILFSLACWYRAKSYDAQAVKFADQQQALFKQVFPNIRTNAPMSRLKSEHARFVSSRQTNSSVELPISAIEPTVRMLESLPPDLAVKYTEFRMENGKLDISAEVRSFTDATSFAQSLEQVGFDVIQEPLQQLAPGRVSTKLRGARTTGKNAGSRSTP
jgi:type II secretory pathway component PulL